MYVDFPRVNVEGETDTEEMDTERTAWMVPYANSGYTITLNVDDREFVDLCAISDDANQPRVIPLEYGCSRGRIDSCINLPPGNVDITVRITSSNAKSTERRVRLHTEVDHYANQYGRIVELHD